MLPGVTDRPRRKVLLADGDGRSAPERARLQQPVDRQPDEACNCPVLDATEWDAVESDWGDITFLATNINAIAGVPIGLDGAREALFARAAELGLRVPEDPMLLISEGAFRRRVLLEVEGDGARSAVVRPGGIAYTRLFEAPWGELKRAARRFRNEGEARYGRQPAEVLAWYLTCRVCSRARNFETLLVAHYPP